MAVVSVIIPVYNAEAYLRECLDSLRKQTFQNYEIVCIDDGSTDSSPEILQSCARQDSRIRVRSKPNEGGGAASARNLGLSLATGKYVQFLDSDDFFEPDMLERLVGKAEETDADVVLCGADRYSQRLGRVVSPYEHMELDRAPNREPFTCRDCPDRIFQLGNILAWNRLYRREFLQRHGLYFEPIPISDDLYLPALALVLAEGIAVVDRSLIHYRFQTGTSQVDSIPRHPEAGYAANYSIVAKLREYGVYEAVKRSWLDVSLRMMRAYFDRMTDLASLRGLYDRYRQEMFPLLDARNLGPEDFYDPRLWEWYRLVQDHSLEEILFLAARGSGDPNTTGILRFRFPYEEVPPDSRVVLVGKGLAGRYWYAQLLLSAHCQAVLWTDAVEHIPAGLEYDQVLEAK